MLHIDVIAVGGLKESYFVSACAEYQKRLGAFCRLSVIEVAEYRLEQRPGVSDVGKALRAEGKAILAKLPNKAFVIALCIEGKMLSSPELATTVERISQEASQLCLIIGGSHGLSNEVKSRADLKLSMSPMTFPHQLSRVMLLEQLYRAFCITGGRKYHK